jgi:hypothetical protein
MGAYGEGALSNDDAMDYVGEIISNLGERMTADLAKEDISNEEIRAMAALCYALYDMPSSFDLPVSKIITRLEAMKTDTEWLDRWLDDDMVIYHVSKDIKRLKENFDLEFEAQQ